MKRIPIDADPIELQAAARELEADDRRKEPRYHPAHERAYLGWWEDEVFHTELAFLENVSMGGAALHTARTPGIGQCVWLCVVAPNRSTWTTAQVVRFENGVARLEFAERLPYELFRLLVFNYPTEVETTHEETVEEGMEEQIGSPQVCVASV